MHKTITFFAFIFIFNFVANGQIVDAIKSEVDYKTHKIKINNQQQCEDVLEQARTISIAGTSSLSAIAGHLASKIATESAISMMEKRWSRLNELLNSKQLDAEKSKLILSISKHISEDFDLIEKNLGAYIAKTKALIEAANRLPEVKESAEYAKFLKLRKEYLDELVQLYLFVKKNRPMSSNFNPFRPLDAEDLPRIRKTLLAADKKILSTVDIKMQKLLQIEEKMISNIGKKLAVQGAVIRATKVLKPIGTAVASLSGLVWSLALYSPDFGEASIAELSLKDHVLFNEDHSLKEVCQTILKDQVSTLSLEDKISWVISYEKMVLSKLEFKNSLPHRPASQNMLERNPPSGTLAPAR